MTRSVEPVRLRIGGMIRRGLIGQETPPIAADDPAPGLFPADSVTRRVHADPSMLVGGLRALLVQTLHPLAMAGVAQHSDYRSDPWRRLHRTATFIGTTTYGSEAEAEAAIAVVRAVHERIVGVAPNGLPYRANDPDLLAWVHATEVDAFARAYDRYGRGQLSSAERDRYVLEMGAVASRLGVEDPPTSWSALTAYLRDVRPDLKTTREAREAVRFLLLPPLPLVARPAYAVIASAAIGLLPPFARRAPVAARSPLADPLAVRPATGLLLAVLGWALAPPNASNPSPAADAA